MCICKNLRLVQYTLCPNKSDPLADFLIACNKVYRIKHNFMNTYRYVLQTIMQSFWKIRLSVTQKSNCKQNRLNVWLYNYSITTCSQSHNDNDLMFKVSVFFTHTVMRCCCYWTTALSMVGWSKWHNSYISRSFKWSTSPIW